MIAEFIDPAILGFILVGVMLFAIFVGFPISFTLIFLLVQGISELLKSYWAAKKGEWPGETK